MVLRSVAAALLAAFLATGCAKPTHQGSQEGTSLIDYALTIGSVTGSARITLAGDEKVQLRDGRAFDAVTFRVEVSDGTFTSERLASYDLKMGSLVRIGDLGLKVTGSEQYAGRTQQWSGSPHGASDPFRCVAGISLSAAFSSTAQSYPKVLELGGLATWDRESGEIDDVHGRVGILTYEEGTRGWPLHAAWTNATGMVCDMRLVKEGTIAVPWGAGEVTAVRDRPKAKMVEGVPPTGDLPLAITLAEADRVARREPLTLAYLRDHPGAWLIEAEYKGELEWSTLARPATGSWTLIFGDPEDRSRIAVEIVSGPTGPLPRQPGARFPDAFVPARLDESAELVPLEEIWDSATQGTTPSGQQSVTIGWYTASSPGQEGTADQAIWQVSWDQAELRITSVFAAGDGTALSTVRGPHFN